VGSKIGFSLDEIVTLLKLAYWINRNEIQKFAIDRAVQIQKK